MNPVPFVIQKLFGTPQIVSPIAQENYLNTPAKMSLYNTTQKQIQDVQTANPGLSFNRDNITNYAMRMGGVNNAILGNMATQQQDDKNAKMALAQPTPMPTAIPTATPTPQNPFVYAANAVKNNIQNDVQTIENTIKPKAQAAPLTDAEIFQQQGISPQTGLSILQAEGGKIGSNNPGNINATDSNPQGAYNYSTHAAGVKAAAETMAKLAKKGGYTGNDPAKQLQAIEKAGYAGDPTTWQQRSASQGGAGKIYKRWSDFVQATPTWNNYSN